MPIFCDFSHFHLFPFSPSVPNHIAYRPERPINGHGYPDTEYSHMQPASQHITECNAENPHRGNSNPHSRFHVICCTQSVRYGEGQRPDQNRTEIVINHNLPGHLRCYIGQIVAFNISGSKQYNAILTPIIQVYTSFKSFTV